ncbi:MAG: dipeptidase [Bacillota bacterium]|nr:dipeptidase [Bacillota bacterium]
MIVDAHCDTLTRLLERECSFAEDIPDGHLDLSRLLKGGIKVQFFAAFVHPRFRHRGMARALALLDAFHRLVLPSPEISLTTNAAEIQAAVGAGKVAGIISVEGGEALEGDLVNLRTLYRLGVRALTLTWNARNDLADGVGEGDRAGGLSRFGLSVIEAMNDLGMLIDVSHLAEPGFWDVLRESRAPVTASHANCRALCDHPRNLTDEQIRALADRGGVVGITFVPDFVDRQAPDLDRLVDHIVHVLRVGGEECPGLGSDFDGFDGSLAGLPDASALGRIPEALVARGLTPAVVDKVLGGNFMHLIGDVLR